MTVNPSIKTIGAELWMQCQPILESLSLVDQGKCLARFEQLVNGWSIESVEDLSALRLFLLVAREQHPLPARLDRQLDALEGDSRLVKTLREAAKNMPHRLVEAHWELVRKAAVRYHIPTKLENEAEFQELQSVGREALFLAAQKHYKNPRGPFKSLAWPLIRESIRQEQSRRHPVPFKIRKKLAALSRLREEAHLRELSLSRETIAQRLKLSPEELKELLQIEGVWGNGIEFETEMEIEDIEAADHRMDQLSMLLEVEDQKSLDLAYKSMIDPEKSVIAKLYFEEKTLREVADEMQLSLPAFKKLHKKALVEMRRLLDQV